MEQENYELWRIGGRMMKGKRDDRAMEDYVDRIYPREDKRKKIWEIKRQQRKLWIVLVCITVLVAGYCFFSETESSLLQENEVKRQHNSELPPNT